MAEHDAVERPDLHAAGGLLRRRWRIMLPFVLIPIAALAFSLSQEKRYTASASLLFSDTEKIASAEPDREAATNEQLLFTDEIRRGVDARVAKRGGVAEDVDATQEGTSNVVKISATDPDPQRAARTANAYAAEYAAFRQATARRRIVQEQRFAQSELDQVKGHDQFARSQRRTLRERVRRLQFDAAHETGGAQVVSAATTPSVPTSPRPVRNTVIGGIAAVFLAILAAVLFERLDPRIVTPQEVERTLERPILGLIRKSRALARAPVAGRPPPRDVDDFLALRAHLRYVDAGRSVRSVLITSSAEGDGKTTIAWNLAAVAAGVDTRVLFVEGDLRHPTLARALGLDRERSLARVLDGSAALADVTQELALPSSENGSVSARVVTVALAGTAPTISSDALAWERLGGALREAAHDFDLVVIDTAPILVVPDAIPLLSQVDAVLVVGRLRRTPRGALVRLKEQLDTVGAPTLGAVVNSLGKDAAYAYGYDGRRG
jgi:succinoglycan biosynthesis transport protein ExoP